MVHWNKDVQAHRFHCSFRQGTRHVSATWWLNPRLEQQWAWAHRCRTAQLSPSCKPATCQERISWACQVCPHEDQKATRDSGEARPDARDGGRQAITPPALRPALHGALGASMTKAVKRTSAPADAQTKLGAEQQGNKQREEQVPE